MLEVHTKEHSRVNHWSSLDFEHVASPRRMLEKFVQKNVLLFYVDYC